VSKFPELFRLFIPLVNPPFLPFNEVEFSRLPISDLRSLKRKKKQTLMHSLWRGFSSSPFVSCSQSDFRKQPPPSSPSFLVKLPPTVWNSSSLLSLLFPYSVSGRERLNLLFNPSAEREPSACIGTSSFFLELNPPYFVHDLVFSLNLETRPPAHDTRLPLYVTLAQD